MSLFKWETLKAISTLELRFKSQTVPGKFLEVELSSGSKVLVWRADNGLDYFCHGLTFDGKVAPGGIISPFGNQVPTILTGHYDAISEREARPGDILVWRGGSAIDVVHSAILTDLVVTPGTNYLDYSSRLQTKNGINPETTLSLQELIEQPGGYGESYSVYRRR
jgi:hypothetical protein